MDPLVVFKRKDREPEDVPDAYGIGIEPNQETTVRTLDPPTFDAGILFHEEEVLPFAFGTSDRAAWTVSFDNTSKLLRSFANVNDAGDPGPGTIIARLPEDRPLKVGGYLPDRFLRFL